MSVVCMLLYPVTSHCTACVSSRSVLRHVPRRRRRRRRRRDVLRDDDVDDDGVFAAYVCRVPIYWLTIYCVVALLVMYHM